MCFSDWLHSCIDFSEINIFVVKNMEAFERQDCQAVILLENSIIYLYCCNPFYDAFFTIPSFRFCGCMGFFVILVLLILHWKGEIVLSQTAKL